MFKMNSFESAKVDDESILNLDAHCDCCKELFDSNDHLPKFLSCHDTLCLKLLRGT